MTLHDPLTDDARARTAAREALAVAALLAVAYLILRTSPALAAGAFSDDGVYLSLGRALADGLGYRSVYAVGDPVQMKYPPGLPALYAVLWTIRRDLAFVHASVLLLGLVATSLAGGLVWWIGRTRLRLGIPVAAVLVVGPFLLEGSVQYFNLAISEPFFMLGWAACLALWPMAVPKAGHGPKEAGGPSSRGGWGWAVAVGAVAAATTLIRTQAVVLVPALALALWWERRTWTRPALLLGAGLVPLLVWRFWHRALLAAGPLTTQPDEAPYAAWAPGSLTEALALLGELPLTQIASYGRALPPHLASWDGVGGALWVALLIGFAVGAVKAFRRAPALVLTTVAVAASVVVWPYAQDRFVLALLPFVGLLAAAGFESASARFESAPPGSEPAAAGFESASARVPEPSAVRPTGAARATGPAVLPLVVLAALVAVVGWRQVQIRGLATEAPSDTAFFFHPAQLLPHNTRFVIAASRWVGTRAAPDDRLLTPLPAAIWLYTGRKGVNATPAEPAVSPSVFEVPGRFLAERVLEDDVTLLLLWNPNFLVTRDAATVQSACPEALRFQELVEEPTRIAVFRIERADPCFVREFLEPAAAALGQRE